MWPELAYISDSILSCVNAGTKYIVINVISGHGPDKQETPPYQSSILKCLESTIKMSLVPQFTGTLLSSRSETIGNFINKYPQPWCLANNRLQVYWLGLWLLQQVPLAGNSSRGRFHKKAHCIGNQ